MIRRSSQTLFLATAAVCVMFLLTLSAPAQARTGDLKTLVRWMTGTFSSEKQAAIDSSYFHIRLVMVRIWKHRKDGYWLYVEQARGDKLDKPYRQRVYHLVSQQDGSSKSEVYELPDPESSAGAWQKKNPLADLTPESLIARDGCAVILRWKDGAFTGGTVESECKSTLRGASYATSEVMVKPDRLVSWDRGFDSSGKQVWGAEKGGYEFLKISKGIPKNSQP